MGWTPQTACLTWSSADLKVSTENHVLNALRSTVSTTDGACVCFYYISFPRVIGDLSCLWGTLAEYNCETSFVSLYWPTTSQVLVVVCMLLCTHPTQYNHSAWATCVSMEEKNISKVGKVSVTSSTKHKFFAEWHQTAGAVMFNPLLTIQCSQYIFEPRMQVMLQVLLNRFHNSL